MYNPTTRLLTLLELLQSRKEISGQELAQRLEVEERSIRRYITMLRDIGIPIEGERGRHGGYALRPGFRLPPLMFNADEITAVMMSLLLLRETGYTSAPAIESAAAKIERVLPAELRQASDALRTSLHLNDVPAGEVISAERILLFSRAVYEGKCLDIAYLSGSGDTTERRIAPYALVLHAQTWYVPGYCYLRDDTRVFRLDRIQSAMRTDQAFTNPADFDARAFVLESLARTPGTHTFEVLIHAPIRTLQEVIPPDAGVLESIGDRTLMRSYSDNPLWMARRLALLEVPFTVQQDEALRAALRVLAQDLLAGIGET